MKTVLQWQEGTDEPEDQPNISNGTDTEPKDPPTRQPGMSHDSGKMERWLRLDGC